MIYVFRTSVKTKKLVEELKPFLNNSLQESKWNFDLHDCDKILRIDSPSDVSGTVIPLLRDKGYDCEELPD